MYKFSSSMFSEMDNRVTNKPSTVDPKNKAKCQVDQTKICATKIFLQQIPSKTSWEACRVPIPTIACTQNLM